MVGRIKQQDFAQAEDSPAFAFEGLGAADISMASLGDGDSLPVGHCSGRLGVGSVDVNLQRTEGRQLSVFVG